MLVPRQSLHPGLVFMVLNGTLHASRGETQGQTPWSTKVICLNDRMVQWWVNVVGTANYQLIGFKAHSTGRNPWPTLLGYKNLRLSSCRPGEKPIPIVLLTEHSNETAPNHILLHPQISVQLSHHPRSLLLH